MMNLDEFNETRQNDYLNDLELQKKNEILNLFRQGKLNFSQYLYNKDINGDWKRQNFIKPSRERQIQMAHYFIASDNTFTSDYNLYDFENVFITCPIPTLIAEGKYDLIWNENKPNLLMKYHPNATLKVFEKSGHNIYSDETENFIKTIEDWVGSVESPKTEDITQWQEKAYSLIGNQLSLIQNSKSFVKF